MFGAEAYNGVRRTSHTDVRLAQGGKSLFLLGDHPILVLDLHHNKGIFVQTGVIPC